MADNKITKRGVTVFIDDTAVKGSIKSIKEELRKLTNVQANTVQEKK